VKGGDTQLKKAIRILITLVLAFCIAAPVIGAEPKMKNPNINLFAGEVKTVDAKEKTIFLKNDSGEMTIVWNEKTVLRSGMSKAANFEDIKLGDIAAVVYDVVDGKNVARSINLQSLKASPAAGQKTKP
jgi:Cu/Ag efflux protein CusF